MNEFLDRRQFIKTVLGGAAATTVMRSSVGPTLNAIANAAPETKSIDPNNIITESTSNPELSIYLPVAIVDLFGIENVLANRLVTAPPELVNATKNFEIRTFTPKTPDEEKLQLIKYLLEVYRNHGNEVAQARTNLLEYLNLPIVDAHQVSAAEAISVGDLSHDDITNPQLTVNISPEIIDSKVAQSTNPIVSLSLELGQVGAKFTYKDTQHSEILPPYEGPRIRNDETGEYIGEPKYFDGNSGDQISKEKFDELMEKSNEKTIIELPPEDRGFEILDGYAGENTLENLKQMVELANKHPDKLFVAASGNPFFENGLQLPDIRAAREAIGTEWPTNLLIAGVIGIDSGIEGVTAHGADIYVNWQDLEKLGKKQMSSFATPVVSTMAELINNQGVNSPEDIKKELFTLTSPWQDSSGNNYAMVNLGLLKQRFGVSGSSLQ